MQQNDLMEQFLMHFHTSGIWRSIHVAIQQNYPENQDVKWIKRVIIKTLQHNAANKQTNVNFHAE